jgi:hypothetical protein
VQTNGYKKTVTPLLIALPILVKAQTPGYGYKAEDKYLYYSDVVKVDTSFTITDLYKDAKLFITKLALTNVNITTDDKTNGTVIADVQEPATFKTATSLGNEPMTLKYTIKLELKKGRYRYTFDSIIITYEDDGKNSPHTLYDLDKSASGVLGNPRSKRILKAMDGLFAGKITLLTNTMSKRSDDF